MTCGFYLRVNDAWLPLEGVQAGVGLEQGRVSSEFVSVGGVRHVQYGQRQSRTWTLDFGHAGPAAVAALELAAAGRAGEVWLWDEQAARKNIFPVAALGSARNPVVTVEGLPLRSLTSAGSTGTRVVKVSPSAMASIRNDDQLGMWPRVSALHNSLLRFGVPPTPAGMSLVSARLRFRAQGVAPAGGMEAFLTTGAWAPPASAAGQMVPGLWAATRDGASIGTVTVPADGARVMNLSSLVSFAGGVVNMRLARSAGSPLNFNPRDLALELTYEFAGLQPDRVIEVQARPTPVRLSFATNAPEGHVFAYGIFGGAPEVPLTTAVGSGLRRLTYDLPGADGLFRLRIPDSAYLLAGLSLSTLMTDAYYAPQHACARVAIDDPTLTLDSLYSGQQGEGQRTVTIREVG